MGQSKVIEIPVGILLVTSDKKTNPNWLKQKRRKGVFYGFTKLKVPHWRNMLQSQTVSPGPSFQLFLHWMDSRIWAHGMAPGTIMLISSYTLVHQKGNRLPQLPRQQGQN